jgi:hypothetical protein
MYGPGVFTDDDVCGHLYLGFAKSMLRNDIDFKNYIVCKLTVIVVRPRLLTCQCLVRATWHFTQYRLLPRLTPPSASLV